MDTFFTSRMAAQDIFLEGRKAGGHGPRGIWFDVDNDLALAYFAIASALLRVSP
jgi:hypothetical protein